MKPFFISTLVSACIISATGFTSHAQTQKSLPRTWPADMTLTIEYGGGMRQFNSTLFISTGTSYEYSNDEGQERKATYTFSQQELDSLLHYLNKKHFNLLYKGIKPTMIYDMGTTSIMLKWNNQISMISTSATLMLEGKYKESFDDIINYIYSMIAGHLSRTPHKIKK